MPEKPQEKSPESFDELTQQLDNEVLSPEVVRVESMDEEDYAQPGSPPPDPRAASPGMPVRAPRPKLPEAETIDDKALQEAASATEDEEVAEPEAALPENQSVHLERDPTAPRPHFWRRKRFWFSFIFLLILGLALAWFIRPARLAIVNALGLRAELSIATTTLPEAGQQAALIKNVEVDINGTKWSSDSNGLLTAKIPYGDTSIVAKKAGYQDATKAMMVDFDPFFYLLGGRQRDESERKMNLQLKAVGIPIKFQATDWLTGDPITGGAFSVGEVVAKPDTNGLVSLTIPATDAKTVKVKAVFGGGYLDKEFDLPLEATQKTVTFVPEGKDYFISRRGGGLAVYSSDLDGSNVTEVVSANPNETSAMAVAVSPSGKYGVLASTREGARDAQGNLLQKLYVVDLANKKLTAVDQGQWFSFADWSGDTLVYTVGERKDGASSQRLASIDATNNKVANISSVASFGAVRVAFGSVFYQANVPPSDPSAGNSPQLRVTPIKGGTEKVIGNKVQQLTQADPERLVFQVGDGSWQEYNANTSQIKTSSAPVSTSRAYLASTTPDGQNRLAFDKVDGKPVIIIRNVGTGQDKQIYTVAGLRGPVRILNNTVIFRVADGAQTADYVVSLKGGAAKKVQDVTASVAPAAQTTDFEPFF